MDKLKKTNGKLIQVNTLIHVVEILTTVMTNNVVDKNADNVKPHSICFLPQYQCQRKHFFNNCKNFRALIDANGVVFTLDSYRQRKISQSDCEIRNNCGKNLN